MRFYLFFLIFVVIGCRSVNENSKQTSNNLKEIKQNTILKDPFRYLETFDLDAEYEQWLTEERHTVSTLLDEKANLVYTPELDSNFVYGYDVTIDEDGQYWYLEQKWNPIEGAVAEPYWYLRTALFYQKDINSEKVCIINPIEFDTSYNINYYKHSWDNKYIAVGLTKESEEIGIIKTFDLESGKFLKGKAINSWLNGFNGVQWMPDNSGFLFTYFPQINPNENDYLRQAKIKTFNLKEGKVLEDDLFSISSSYSSLFKKEYNPRVYTSGVNDKYIIGTIGDVSEFKNAYITECTSFVNGDPRWEQLWQEKDEIKNHKLTSEYIYFLSASNNSNFTLNRTPVENYESTKPEILFDPKEKIITDYTITSSGIFVSTSKNGVTSELYRISENQIEQIDLPFSAADIALHSISNQHSDLWLDVSGWTMLETKYHYDSFKNTFKQAGLSESGVLGIEDIEVLEIEVKAHDNTQIPVSIIRNTRSDKATRNVLLTGYGAFGISYSPSLDMNILKWLHHGGVYVVAHIRGGGEKGADWHKDGMKGSKENSWLDFISVSEYLINEGITTQNQLCITGASAGGISAGMAVIARPDLFKAVVLDVGVLNPSRNEFSEMGKTHINEFGSMANPEEAKYLLKMDPYQNIEDDQNYPAMYITSGINDVRVAYWHSTKFAAKLKSRKGQKNIVLLDVGKGDHGAGQNYATSEQEALANKSIAFFLWQVGHPDFQ